LSLHPLHFAPPVFPVPAIGGLPDNTAELLAKLEVETEDVEEDDVEENDVEEDDVEEDDVEEDDDKEGKEDVEDEERELKGGRAVAVIALEDINMGDCDGLSLRFSPAT